MILPKEFQTDPDQSIEDVLRALEEGWTTGLIPGRSEEVLKVVADESMDALLTDPPYNIGKAYEGYSDRQKEDVYWDMIAAVFSECYRVLKDKCHLTFTCAQKQIWTYKELLEGMGFTFRHIGVWHNPKRKAGSWPGMWPYSWEPVMDFTKGKYRKLNNSNSVGYMDVWVEKEGPFDHPTARPIKMWEELLGLITDEGDIVLDPFVGSGTTSAVAAKIKRRSLGIDVSKEYIYQAMDNVEEYLRQTKDNVETLQ